MSEAERLARFLDSNAMSKEDYEAAAELRRLSAVEQELESLKRAVIDAEPVAWSTGIRWNPVAHYQSEQVQKLTRNSQPEYGFTEPLYTLKGIK